MSLFKTLNSKFISCALCTAGVLAMIGSSAALAQGACSYPDKPVNVVVGYSPGGGTDTVARILSKEVQQFANGQPFVVVNKPGGAQVPAMKFTMAAAKDGYTLQFFSAGSAVMATMLRDHGINWIEEFQPISMVSITNTAIIVNANSPVKTPQELLAWIKDSNAKGEPLRWGHAGRGSSTHIAATSWLMKNGVLNMTQDVPFKGSGKSKAALIGEQVAFGSLTVSHLKNQDKLRGVGLNAGERDPVVSNVPTMQELGVPYVSVDLPLLLAAPKGVPQDIINCLDAAIKKTTESESFKTAMNKSGFGVSYRDSAGATALMQDRYKNWQPVIDVIKARMAAK